MIFKISIENAWNSFQIYRNPISQTYAFDIQMRLITGMLRLEVFYFVCEESAKIILEFIKSIANKI